MLGVRQPAPPRATRVVQDIDLKIAAFSPDGHQRAGQHLTVPVTLNVPNPGGVIGYELLSHVELAPGRYQLRVAAQSAPRGVQPAPRTPAEGHAGPGEKTAARSGSVYCDLDVPDFARDALSLSGAVLSVVPGVASGPKDALAAVVPIVPTTMREFTRDDKVTVFLRAYQDGRNPPLPVTLEVRIVDADGAHAFETKATLTAGQFAKDRGAEFSLDMPVATLRPGPHLLTIEAKAGKRSARRDVRFEVH